MSPTTRSACADDSPLKWQFDLVQGEGGTAVLQTTCSRGAVSVRFQTPCYQESSGDQPSLKKILKNLAAALRRQLEQAGCLTDHHFVWIRFGEGPWEPDLHPPEWEEDETRPHELRSWYDQLRAVTAPSSVNRLRGEILNELNQMLGGNLDDGVIDNLVNVAIAHRGLSVAGNLSKTASLGMRTQASLAEGPKAISRSSAKKLEVVCRHAHGHWQHQAFHRGDRTNTAAVIAPLVNDELRSLGLSPVQPKTIADYISQGISGGLFEIGESRHQLGQPGKVA